MANPAPAAPGHEGPGSSRPGAEARLGADAAGLGAGLPALLAAAEHLADTVAMGAHGRRRAGLGDAFWQYRLAQPGDPARAIDWRRSARADQTYVREREAEIAQSVMIWVDDGQSMDYSGDPRQRPTKAARGRLLGMAAALLLLRGGERVGLMASLGARGPATGQAQAALAALRSASFGAAGSGAGAGVHAISGAGHGEDTAVGGADGLALPPRAGRAHRLALAARLMVPGRAEYAAPDPQGLPARGMALMLTDGLGESAALERCLADAAARGVRGALVQLLDPAEEAFAFDGRTIFESMGGGLRHETRRAGDLRARYQGRLAERRAQLQAASARAGWLFQTHHTDHAAQAALMWIWRALDRGR